MVTREEVRQRMRDDGIEYLLVQFVDINGSPELRKVLFATFDINGLWTLPGVVPPGLSGNVMTFKTLGFAPTGKVDTSNGEVVTFQ